MSDSCISGFLASSDTYSQILEYEIVCWWKKFPRTYKNINVSIRIWVLKVQLVRGSLCDMFDALSPRSCFLIKAKTKMNKYHWTVLLTFTEASVNGFYKFWCLPMNKEKKNMNHLTGHVTIIIDSVRWCYLSFLQVMHF